MQRKLITQGQGGFTVYIPKKWIKQNKLKQGDYIEINEKDSNLLISTKTPKEKIISITINNENKHLIRTTLASFYRLGYTKITLTLQTKLQLKKLKEITSSLKGYEIEEFSQRSCIIKDISTPQDHDTKNQIIKFFQKINYYYIAIFKEKQSKQEIESLRKDLLSHRDFTQRTIVREKQELSYELYSFILILEKLSACYYRLYDKIKNKKDKEILNQFHSILQDLYKTYSKNDQKQANNIYLVLENMRSQIPKKIKSTKNKYLQEYILHIHRLFFTLNSRLQIITIKTN